MMTNVSRINYSGWKIQAKSMENLQHLRCETSRTFRKKKREYLKGKTNKLETNNKNKNVRDLYRGVS
jgi:hypothetical protein